jgi:hypothetical protein
MSDTNDWKPEVGKTAWFMVNGTIKQVKCKSLGTGVLRDCFAVMLDRVGVWVETTNLFPTVEAVLASIKVYDLKGKEVVISRAEPEIDELASEGRILSQFELEFYNFCKKDPDMIAKFSMALLQQKSAESGESPTKEDNRDGGYTN